MKKKLLVKTIDSLGFLLIAFFILTCLQISSCNSDNNEIKYDSSVDIGNTDFVSIDSLITETQDSVSIDSLITETQDSTSLLSDSLPKQFIQSLPVVKISIDENIFGRKILDYLWLITMYFGNFLLE